MNKAIKIILLYIIINFKIQLIHCKCDNVRASLSQRILNEGFHREIKYIIKFNENGLDLWSHGACRLSLEQTLPSGAFVNGDELRDLWRFQKTQACAVGEVDIEKPNHLSRPTIVHMYSPINSSRILITLPIHLRYHRAKSKGGFETVKIDYPWVLIRCPNNVFRMCNPDETLIAPCAACSPHKCSWHNITTVPLTSSNNLEMNVPIGDLDDFTYVALITFLVCFGGCFYVIIVLSKVDTTEIKVVAISSQPLSRRKKRR